MLTRLAAFARADDGRPALLGFVGATLIALGGLGAGSTRQHDPLLESLHLSWLRFGHGLVLSSILLWTGVALMLIAWLALGRRVVDRTATDYTMIATTGLPNAFRAWRMAISPICAEAPESITTRPWAVLTKVMLHIIPWFSGVGKPSGEKIIQTCFDTWRSG